MRVEIKIRGVRETMQNIIEFEKEADRQLGLAMARVVFKITQDAKTNAPVRTGFLRDNIFPNVTLGRTSGIMGRVTSSAPYSIYQEFGTSRGVTGKRFMTRAVNSNLSFVKNELGDALRRATLRARSK